jgi:hypothetical protein
MALGILRACYVSWLHQDWSGEEGIHLLGHFERQGKYIWVPFLDPEDIKILSLGAIWNLSKGIGLS